MGRFVTTKCGSVDEFLEGKVLESADDEASEKELIS